MSRVSSYSDYRKDARKGEAAPAPQESSAGLFHIIQQLGAAENALWNILDGLRTNTTHASFFCREYWGCSCSQAQLSLERLHCQERLKRQVQQACVLESLSLGVTSHLCSGVMTGISVTIRSRLRNLLYYTHENCLVLLDLVCQRWMQENQTNGLQDNLEATQKVHCPENLNLDILVRVKRYRRLRRGEHVMALRQHNEMIVNVVRQLCKGAAPKRPPLSSRSAATLGDRSPGARPGLAGPAGGLGAQTSVLTVVNDILTGRGTALDRQRPTTIRARMLQHMTFRPLLNTDESDPDCPWPTEDPYVRYGSDQFSQDSCVIWFEPLPPMLPNLEQNPMLPPVSADTYTLVLDLDETLVHYFEHDGMGNYDIRPGMHEFLERMHHLGFELVIFTAATQDYADWVIDQIDPGRLIHYRLYRQHALPWGPIFVKDMSRLGRDLDRTLIIDNVQENFMLQPNNGVFIITWYDDPHDQALFNLSPLLEELITSRTKVPEILDKYRDQIPTMAGFDRYSQLGAEYSEYDLQAEDGMAQDPGLGQYLGHSQELVQQTQPAPGPPQEAAPQMLRQEVSQHQPPPHSYHPTVWGQLDAGHDEWGIQEEVHEEPMHPGPGVMTPQAAMYTTYTAPQEASLGVGTRPAASVQGWYPPQQQPQFVPQQRVPAPQQPQLQQHQQHQQHQQQQHNGGQVQAMTLSMSLQMLSTEDPGTLFIVRRINKLGFKAARKIRQHFSSYGHVVRVLVAHSTVRQSGDPASQWRRRPSSLGFVHMASASAVLRVLARGAQHEVEGCVILVQKFVRQQDPSNFAEEEEYEEACESGDSVDKLEDHKYMDKDSTAWERQQSALSGVSTATASTSSSKASAATQVADIRPAPGLDDQAPTTTGQVAGA